MGQRALLAAGFETFALRLMLVILAFAGSVIVSRLLGPEGRGIYYLPIVAAGVLITFGKLGLEQANVFLVGTRRIPLENLAAQNLLVSLLVGGFAALLLLAAPSALPEVFTDVPLTLLLIAGLTIPFSMHTQFVAGLQNLAGEVTWQFRAGVLAGVAQLVILVVLIPFGAINVNSVLLTTLFGTILGWALTLRRSGIDSMRVRWDGGLIRESLAQSLILHVAMLMLFLHLRVDMFMVKGIVGTYALGLYSLAVVLAETVLLAPDSLSIALLPRQMGNTVREAAAIALGAARLNVAIGAVVALPWIVVGSPVIGLFFGGDFVPAFEPLVALLPAMIFIGVQRVCGAPVLRVGKPVWIALINASTLTLNVLLNLAWIPALGATGAGLASSVSYGIGALLFFTWAARLAGVPVLAALRPTKVDYDRARSLASVVTTLRSVLGRRRPVS